MHHEKRSRFMLTSQPILHFTETRSSIIPIHQDLMMTFNIKNHEYRITERERENQPEDGLGKGKRRGDNP
jgi:hypothetical protein